MKTKNWIFSKTGILFFIGISTIPHVGFSQKLSKTQLDKTASDFAKSSFPILRDILSIPNDAFYPEDIEKNVKWCETEFSARAFSTTRIKTKGAPLLLAERKHKKAKKTVLIYLQIDGQPVDTTRWDQKSPYQPALKKQVNGKWEEIPWESIANYEDDWRVFARAASDAKGPVAMFLAALDAAKQEKIVPNFNIKVIMDFEEEMGSPNLPQAVLDNKEMLKADMLIIFDGPRHITNKPTLTFGARGISTVQLTTYGPVVPQHSGHFGNYAPNPALRLSKLLASMKDEDGLVTIPGFYDGINIGAETEKILKAVPDDEEQIKNRLQIATTDKVGKYYQEAIQYPSLNIRGMQSGWINEKVRTIIPGWARAEIDIRLVLESDPERLIQLVKNHIETEGYIVLDREPTQEERLKHEKIATFTYEVSYQSFRTDFDSEVGLWLRSALKGAFDKDPIMIRMSGGSIPISPFVTTLDIPAVTVPTVNRDNNQHSPNENLRLGNYREGIKTMIAILSEKL
ncbi:M20/M25/M40 family metallo-hydrolase [Flagellimonas meridianipacifica]|uniref:Acetylornithine deacetylase/succinyl-diaminopimelate desuccinylase-like protein n=1 Tax=Flagellimonas meridianipacifica TaxID=1080225 RepID=A0A2T0MA40_9FLAO|nr:M20/M25/M40 family metallo-hydrolase [Allomuricauda pacifica]PRX54340.1 acetylornithine deacetylase/succinyl-diaminopimelate desuccinylase-like protein [Allomuricauda pacifica]